MPSTIAAQCTLLAWVADTWLSLREVDMGGCVFWGTRDKVVVRHSVAQLCMGTGFLD